MKKLSNILKACILVLLMTVASDAFAVQPINLGKVVSGAKKAISAATLSDNDIKQYVAEYVAYSDKENKVAADDNPYAVRLKTLTDGLDQVDGTPLNFKVYLTDDVNAFACADGSVRVYSGLMDLMSDDEVLGVIGHEIGHVAHKDSKNAFKQALINSAILDGIASTGTTAQRLTDSQLAAVGNSLITSKFSRKQESNADDYGYDFLKSHGKNPWAMAMAFQKLQNLESGAGGSSSALQKMFSSHPSTPDRIKHIVQKCKKDGIAAPEGCTIAE